MATFDVVHKTLPSDEWWACEFPERPPEPRRSHYRRGCRHCWPAFLASAKTTNVFIVNGSEKAVYDFDRTLEWWFSGEVTPNG